MEGITILNTVYEYASLINPLWVLAFIGICLIISLIGLFTIDYDKVQIACKVLIAFSLIGFVGSIIGASIETDKIVDTKYQVLISEEVNLKEFQEKYEIIEKNGEIYTIREIK